MLAEPVVFCAIDTDNIGQATQWAKEIGPITGGLKLGMEFFNAFGPQGVDEVMKACPSAKLFIDLKYHDIPNTVAGAVRTISRRFKPMYLNVHAAGGTEMMKAARDACDPATKLLAVTVLTSLDEGGVRETGHVLPSADLVQHMAVLSKECGMGGVVCSSYEIEALRKICGPDFVLMVPGIRPAGLDIHDQKRVMTPKEALYFGATHLVIGRPITHSDFPAKTAQGIVDSVRLSPEPEKATA